MKEVNNGLCALNSFLKSKNKYLDLHLIGAYALFLHDLDISRKTDLDPVNTIEDKEVISFIEKSKNEMGFDWYDFGASSLSLPDGYKKRLTLKRSYSNLNLYVLSIEDLIILKVTASYYRGGSGENKDFDDLMILNPNRDLIKQAVQFMLSAHSTDLSGRHLEEFKEDLRLFEKELRDAVNEYFQE